MTGEVDMGVGPGVTVVVPTIGRPSLERLLSSLADARGPLPAEVVLVDDRRQGVALRAFEVPASLAGRVRVVAGGGVGPAAARNRGWRSVASPWIAFLDDDVEVSMGWLDALARDIADAGPRVAGVQGRIRVPLPAGRRPTDWERSVAGLERAQWATADLVYRRAALVDVDGFDERFPRAYREDADLGLRLVDRGWQITDGERMTHHPVRPVDAWVSLRTQAGNADDARMRSRHGPAWRARAGVAPGRRPRHLAVTLTGLVALGAVAAGRRRVAAVTGLAWLAGTVELAAARIRPGPRTAREVATMVVTSVVIPAAASWHWLRGWVAIGRERAGSR